MNAQRLLDHFDRLADAPDAPDAIPRLRRFVLDLAVRGRLSSHEKWPKQPEPLSTFATLQNGYAFKSEWFARNGTRLLRNVNVGHGVMRWDETACLSKSKSAEFQRFQLGEGDIVLSLDRPFIVTGTKVARVRPQDLPCLLLQRVGRFQPNAAKLHQDYLYLWLNSPHFSTQINPGRSNGVPHISSKQVESATIFVPPLAEQHRIVSKVDELMSLCDRLEAAQAERDSRQDRLVRASLHRLTQPHDGTDAPSPRAHARFTLDHLPRLTTRPEHIPQLRQTILNLAVCGKLVRQDPMDEAAPPYRVAVGPEKNRLAISLPHGWSWARVADVAESRLGKMLDKAKNSGRPYRYLRNTNVHWFDIRMDDLKTMRISDSEIANFLLRNGDVLICEGGHGIGRTAVWQSSEDEIVFQKALHRVRPGPLLASDFFAHCLFVYFHAGILETYYTGVGIPHFTGVALSKLVFPLPPLAEQRRIVAKVDELMALCDRLESQLTAGRNECRSLLEAVLHQAISPTA